VILKSWLAGWACERLALRAVPVELAQVVRGAGEEPFAFARGKAAAGHRGHFLAGLELPEHRFHGAGPHPVVLPAAGMLQAPPGAGGGREPVQVPGPLRGADAAADGVFGQRREKPQAVGAGTGEARLAGVPGVGEHGAQLRADASLGQLLAAGVQEGVQQGAAGGCWDSIVPTMTCCAVTTSCPL